MKHKSLYTVFLAGLLAGCVGDTGDNGQASVTNPLVSDGGAGGSLEIVLKDSDGVIGVGDTVGFFVIAKDPQGRPQQFIRIICDSERGVAIIEPSRRGVAVESTDENGEMSGVIGGLTPGSYLFECRGQQGFNLVDRVTVRVSGEVPADFQGFPGAAGGNIGGGRLIDNSPEVGDGVGLRVSQVRFRDAGGETVQGPLDTIQNVCETGTASECNLVCTNEPFTFATYTVTVQNQSPSDVFINTIEFRRGSTTVVGAQGQAVEIKKNTSGTITGNLTTLFGCSGGR